MSSDFTLPKCKCSFILLNEQMRAKLTTVLSTVKINQKNKKTKFNLKSNKNSKISIEKKKLRIKKASNKDTGIRALADLSPKKFISRNIAITEVKFNLQKQ